MKVVAVIAYGYAAGSMPKKTHNSQFSWVGLFVCVGVLVYRGCAMLASARTLPAKSDRMAFFRSKLCILYTVHEVDAMGRAEIAPPPGWHITYMEDSTVRTTYSRLPPHYEKLR